jgi:hypothetical protein
MVSAPGLKVRVGNRSRLTYAKSRVSQKDWLKMHRLQTSNFIGWPERQDCFMMSESMHRHSSVLYGERFKKIRAGTPHVAQRWRGFRAKAGRGLKHPKVRHQAGLKPLHRLTTDLLLTFFGPLILSAALY